MEKPFCFPEHFFTLQNPGSNVLLQISATQTCITSLPREHLPTDSFGDCCPRQFREHKGRPVTPVSQGLHYKRCSLIAREPSLASSFPSSPTQTDSGATCYPVGSEIKGFPGQEAPVRESEVCPPRQALEDVAFPQNPALQLPAGNTQT